MVKIKSNIGQQNRNHVNTAFQRSNKMTGDNSTKSNGTGKHNTK